jgi:hypothetical protein
VEWEHRKKTRKNKRRHIYGFCVWDKKNRKKGDKEKAKPSTKTKQKERKEKKSVGTKP